MELQRHLFNRREIVVLMLDLDDETLGLTDFALPLPPSFTRTATTTPYVPPQTRLDVTREALITFVSAKLRSAPNSSLMVFGLYAVRGDGRREEEEEVVELVAPAVAGSAGGRAVQEALRGINVGSYVYGTHAGGAGSSQVASSANKTAPPYHSVIRHLKRLKDTADQLQMQRVNPSTPRSPGAAAEAASFLQRKTNTSSNADGVTSSPRNKSSPRDGSSVSVSNKAGGPNVYLVVHGIVVRSRSTAPPKLFHHSTPPSPSPAQPLLSAATQTEPVDPHVWLDVLVLDGLKEASTPGVPATTAGRNSTEDAAAPREDVVHGCQCALLDPVELTGIKHRGLALGPALVRVMSLPEARTTAFIQRPLSFLKILRSTNASSDAAFRSASSAKSTMSNTPTTSSSPPAALSFTPATITTAVAAATVATPSASRDRITPRHPTSTRANDGGRGAAASTNSTATGVVGRTSANTSSGLPTFPPKLPASQQQQQQQLTPYTALPCLPSNPNMQCGSGVSDAHRLTGGTPSNNTSFRAEKTPENATLPAMPPKSHTTTTPSFKHASRQHQQQQQQQQSGMTPIVKERKKRASRSPSIAGDGTSAAIANGETGEVPSPVVHRYATVSPDAAAMVAAVSDNDKADESGPNSMRAPAVLLKRTAPDDPTPSLEGRSPEGSSTGARRTPSTTSPLATTSITRPARCAGLAAAATTQAPLSSAAVLQQQRQQQQLQQMSSSQEQLLMHHHFSPQPPDEDVTNPRRKSAALSAGIQRSSPPPTSTAARRLSAGAQLNYAPQPPTGSGGRHYSPPRPMPQSFESQNRTA